MNSIVQWVGQRLVLVLTAAGVLALALVLVVQHTAASGPPFALSAMHPRLHVAVTDLGPARRTVDRLTGGRLGVVYVRPFAHRQQIVGQLDFRTVGKPSDAGGVALFVIDNRLHRPLNFLQGVGPPGSNVGQGWDGRYQRLAGKYPWLRPLAAVPDGSGGYADPGLAVGFPPGTRGPVTFDAVLDRDALPVTDVARDLTFVLAYVGDSRGAWALRLPVTALATA